MSNCDDAKETVLLVDDDALVRKLAHTILEMNGYHVLDASDGFQALEISRTCRESTIHLLLTDLVMPGMNGWQLAENFLLSRPTSRVLFMSGYVEPESVSNGFANPDIHFIQKPFTPHGLAQAFRETLDFSTKAAE